jgi:hypothetical protein
MIMLHKAITQVALKPMAKKERSNEPSLTQGLRIMVSVVAPSQIIKTTTRREKTRSNLWPCRASSRLMKQREALKSPAK